MPLSSEDALRLNVMLANKPLAIRIHESSMTLFGLMNDGEVTVKLNPDVQKTRAFIEWSSENSEVLI